MNELGETEVRALRRKARLATLQALQALGGEGRRREIGEHALRHGGFTDRERRAPAPEKASNRFGGRVEYELHWTLTNLKRDGLVSNPAWGRWALSGAAAAPEAAPLAAPVTGSRLDQLRAMPYRDYLRSPEWRETRGAALVRAGHACLLDATHITQLEVHHRTYERLGAERPEDVVVLCHDCHRHHHQLVGRPRREERVATSVAPPTGDEPLVVPLEWSPPAATGPKPGWLRRLLG